MTNDEIEAYLKLFRDSRIVKTGILDEQGYQELLDSMNDKQKDFFAKQIYAAHIKAEHPLTPGRQPPRAFVIKEMTNEY